MQKNPKRKQVHMDQLTENSGSQGGPVVLCAGGTTQWVKEQATL